MQPLVSMPFCRSAPYIDFHKAGYTETENITEIIQVSGIPVYPK